MRGETVARGLAKKNTVYALRGVRHDGNVGKPLSIKRLTNCTDAAVHHVGRRNDVRASTSLRHSLLAEIVDSLVIHDNTVGANHAIMAHRVVRVEGDVRIHLKVRESVLQKRDGALRQTVGVEALLRSFGLEVVGSLGEDNNLVHTRSAKPREPYRSYRSSSLGGTGRASTQ